MKNTNLNMRAALVVHKTKQSFNETIDHLITRIDEAANMGAQLVLMSEAAIQGFNITDDQDTDLLLGISQEGLEIQRFRECALRHGIYVGVGYLEREGDKLYDSAILIEPTGVTAMNYRRMSKGWRDATLEESIYGEGSSISVCQTPFGKMGFLICGDFFDDAYLAQAKDADLDILLYPYARSFENGDRSQTTWESVYPEYLERVKKLGITTLGVNYIDDFFIGGAFVAHHNGESQKSLDVDIQETLYWDI